MQTRNHRQNLGILHQKLIVKLRMKCPNCGHWNRIQATKLFIPQAISEPKVKAFIPIYKPLKTETCKKCGQTIAEPKELIRIVKSKRLNGLTKTFPIKHSFLKRG